MTQEEIIQAITDDKMMPFIQPEQLAEIVDFVIKNYNPSLPSNLDEAAQAYYEDKMMESEKVQTDDIPRAFKAGAEWGANQGITGTGVLAYVNQGYGVKPELQLSFYAIFSDEEWENGEEVLVQVRKIE